MAPKRVQLSREKGWRMPENTVSVARPTKWGNPFTKEAAVDSGYCQAKDWRSFVVDCFREWLAGEDQGRSWWQGPESNAYRAEIRHFLPGLRGKNLACWCPLVDEDGNPVPCHADVLLELANASPTTAGERADT